MLTPASDEAKELTRLCQGRFTGDPSFEFEVMQYHTVNEDTDDENIEEFKSHLREENRLAATLWKIEQDALIVPRGAYVLQPSGDVERNRTFEGRRCSISDIDTLTLHPGLTPAESGKLSNYYHFRQPIRLQQKSLLRRAAMDKSLHFLDPINEDIPIGTISSASF